MKKTAQQKLDDIEQKEFILEETDMRYAIKLVERIVFGMVGLILLGVMSALIAIVVVRK